MDGVTFSDRFEFGSDGEKYVAWNSRFGMTYSIDQRITTADWLTLYTVTSVGAGREMRTCNIKHQPPIPLYLGNASRRQRCPSNNHRNQSTSCRTGNLLLFRCTSPRCSSRQLRHTTREGCTEKLRGMHAWRQTAVKCEQMDHQIWRTLTNNVTRSPATSQNRSNKQKVPLGSDNQYRHTYGYGPQV